MIIKTDPYRNLADWPVKDWQNLNIHLFIAANFNRYCASLIKKIGARHLPSDAQASMCGLFCDVAFKPLTTAHQKHLNAEGERRNQVMLGTLKKIADTRMVEALIREFPMFTSLDHLEGGTDMEHLSAEIDLSVTWPSSQAITVQFSADHSTPNKNTEADALPEELELIMRMETVRHHLTPGQYQHLRFTLCEGMSPREIAEHTGLSPANVRIMLQNARRKMLTLVPPHLIDSVKDCLYRDKRVSP